MLPRVHVIERSFQLADSGDFQTRSQILRALAAEGYGMSQLIHFEGPAITRQLTERCVAARRPVISKPPV